MVRDVTRAIEHVERVMAHALDESSAKLSKKEAAKTRSSTVRVWRPPRVIIPSTPNQKLDLFSGRNSA